MALKRSLPEEVDSDSEVDDSDLDPDFDPALEHPKKIKSYFGPEDLLLDISKVHNETTPTNPSTSSLNDKPVVSHLGDLPEVSSLVANNNEDATELYLRDMLEAALQSVFEIVENPNKKMKRLRKGKEKVRRNLESHKLLPPCLESCRKHCSTKIDEYSRQKILESFWKLNFSQRRLYLTAYVKEENVKTRTTQGNFSKRTSTLKYYLPQYGEDSRSELRVCKTMFLHTLGQRNDSIITQHLKARRRIDSNVEIKDRRGESARRSAQIQKAMTDTVIENHVNSFHPYVSHYKLDHAPLRRYLSPEINISLMWRDFCTSRQKISYEKYRQVVDKLNIGFDHPSQDDCGVCSKYSIHNGETAVDLSHNPAACETCIKHNVHKTHYTSTRRAYKEDKDRDWQRGIEIYTVDLQKVLLLPKMTTKESFFIPRLVTFNETFAPLNKDDNKCYVWHEATRGRNAPDIASTFYHVIKNSNPNVMSFIFWMDNCSAQNKNWTLYTMFACLVNADWGPENIIVKYFEPGHSFMKADSVHGQIGREWRKRKQILDVNDFVDVINASSKKNKPIVMRHSDFYPFIDGSKQRRKNISGEVNIPLLDQIKIAEFRKGSRSLFYKTSFDETEYAEANFLKSKFDINQQPVAYNIVMIEGSTQQKNKK
ncbi:unnamed protein product [Acanthoscelides obtectus]|uniref:DUF7869 domain-containing protein n=1 Tax=Acanthoscelides obtectus TaxID=200917 RepID=A0A9P0LT79_ACAOB|nr:unnamed protein product [Acanthoscelides obtectus]CAK1677924.1 hypothetical protein AOBTE_LOCUS31652 [Acanthoscelides obtectus]